ncbi:TPA: hypothetical protein MYR09_000680 [Citrobacter farmeri]|uniref:hypothetical protein n=1 Tax=Citrobacter farmeri TaxID=67824 RepID=UPI00388F32B7|nr:hypothetical protein [Citrobacter farmeri]
MHAAFVVAGMDEKLPFNPSPEQYEQEQRSAECYINPVRLAWVASELQERRRAGDTPTAWMAIYHTEESTDEAIYLTRFALDKFINEAGWQSALTEIIPLYGTPPAPVVPDEKPMPKASNMFAIDAVAAIAEVRGWNACRAAMLQGSQPVSNRDELSSPVIPDGYVLVPIVPTEDMIINGFESEPDPHFSDEKEWEEYEALSGCRQAARRAELCWRR